MANKPIIDIDVNDDSFRKFFELFKEYSEKVEDMPESWKKLGNAMGSGMGKFNKLSKQSKESMAMSAANASLIVDELKKATHAQKQFHTATRQSQGAMHTLAKTTEKVGKTLFGLGKFMLGFGGVTSLLGGLGIGELSSIAFNRQRQARGLGMSIGQVQSFKANLNRYVDVGSLLENVANAKTDQTKWWAFSSMGIPINQAINEGTGRLSTQLINRARSIWMQGPQTLQYAQAKGLTQFFSLDDLRRLASSSTGGLATAESAAFRNAASMGFSARTAREWSQLSIALTKAKLVVESALIRGLAPLAPQFSAMAKVTAKLISGFIESGKAKKYVNEFSDEMKKVVAFLGSKKFQSDLQRFEEAINDVTTGILKVAHFFGWGPKKPTGQTGNVGFSSPRANNYNYSMKGTMRVFGIPIPNQPLYMGPNYWKTNPRNPNNVIGLLEKQGLTPIEAAAMASQFAAESHYNEAAVGDKGLAYGIAQWHPARQALFQKVMGKSIKGSSFQDQVAFAVWELKNRYPSVYKALGQAKTAAQASAILTHGYEIPAHMKAQTQAREKIASSYLDQETAKNLATIAKQRPSPVHVTITNHTGAKVSVSSNAVAM